MKKGPLFSIVLPSYNRPRLLERAVKSVLAQTYPIWELIIIDDGTNKEEILDITKFQDARIQYHWQENHGKGPARNAGLDKVEGEYICFLDDDDTYAPDHLQSFVNGITTNQEIKIFRTGSTAIEDGKEVFQSKFLQKNDEKETVTFLLRQFFSLYDLCISTLALKGHRFENYELWEDKLFLIPLIQKYKIHQIHKRTVFINEHEFRSVNRAFLDTEQIKAQIEAVENAFTKFNLEKKYDLKSSLKEKIISNLLATHFYHSKIYGGYLKSMQVGWQLFKLRPSFKLCFTFAKYFLMA